MCGAEFRVTDSQGHYSKFLEGQRLFRPFSGGFQVPGASCDRNVLSVEWKIRLEQLVSRLVRAESEVSVQSSVAFRS